MNIIIIIMIIMIFFSVLCCFFIKNDNFCDNLKSLRDLKSNLNIKTKYINLEPSSTYETIKKIFNKKHEIMCFENYLYENSNYLYTVSKFIDYKINKDKKKYRSKNNITLIENLAIVSTQSIFENNSYCIFKIYKNNYQYFSIKNKENKVFKFLVGKHLIYELCKIESELIKISTIISKYKKRKFVVNYKKSIYNTAKFYSILKYNPNSTKLLYSLDINKINIVQNLFCEMNDAARKIQTIITYLKVMF